MKTFRSNSAALASVLSLALFVPMTVGCGGDDAAGDGMQSGDDDDDGDDGDDGGNGNGDGKQTGEGPCEQASECSDDVCVAIIDGDHPPNYCTELCTAGSCPDGFVCDESTFALAELSFCRYTDDEQADPEPPEDPPVLPCIDDVDCDDGFLCAELGDIKGCAKACSSEPDCDVPPHNGITFDLAVCGEDDNGKSVCVGDPACYPDPSSCVGGLPG